MGAFIQQVFNLLTTETGSLTYNLVLAFSIASALQISYSYWHANSSHQARRLVIGLGMLLALRLALWISAGAGWQGLFNASLLLPSLDRAVDLLSLLVIIWLWAFPNPSRNADLSAVLVGLLIATLSITGTLWLTGTPEHQGFNGSVIETIYNVTALALIVCGALILVLRRADGWSIGLSMLTLLAAGQIAALAYSETAGDYSGGLRLFQLIAYPLLLFLPQRVAVTPSRLPLDQAFDNEALPARQAEVLHSALLLAGESDPDTVNQNLTRAVAQGMQADLCALVLITGHPGQFSIQSCYNQPRQQSLPGLSLDNRLVPALVAALSQGQPLRLAEDSSSPDQFSLGRVLDLDHTGSLLAAPLPLNNKATTSGLVLLNPQSKKDWTDEDQAVLSEIAKASAALLNRAPGQSLEDLNEELSRARLKAQAAQDYADQLQQEKGLIQEQLAVLSETTGKDREQLVSLAAMVAYHGELQQTLSQLQEENEDLKQAKNKPSVSHATIAGHLGEQEHFEGELRLALEEVAYLRSALAKADQKIVELTGATSEAQLSKDQSETIVSIAQELLQPISSVMGYTDFLLGETIGFLGSQQRKLLERVKIATERMTKLADDLLQAASPEKSPGRLELEPLDLSQVIDEVVARAKPEFSEKNISLQVEVPHPAPTLTADRRVLQQILVTLLHNARTATPDSGQVALRVGTQSSDGAEDFILMQFVDSGAGIPPQDLPRVFTQLYRPAQAVAASSGENSNGLLTAKTMVERLGGRVWVDSCVGQGSTFSVILPGASTAPPLNGNNGEKHE